MENILRAKMDMRLLSMIEIECMRRYFIELESVCGCVCACVSMCEGVGV